MSVAAQEAYVCFTPEDSTMTFYYDTLRSTRPGTTFSANIDGNRTIWSRNGICPAVAQVVFDPSFVNFTPRTTGYLLEDMRNWRSIIGMEYLNTSQVKSMHWMFKDCRKLTSIDLSHLNTENVTNMNRMFMSCESLTSIDLSNFNTENVITMGYLFSGCQSLTSIDLTPLNTANVTNMEHMFSSCQSLTNIDLSPLNTANVTNMSGMFSWCLGLTNH